MFHFSIHNWRKFSETWTYSNWQFFFATPNNTFSTDRLNEVNDIFHSILKVSNRFRLEQIWQMIGSCSLFRVLDCSTRTSFSDDDWPNWAIISTASSSAKWSSWRTISSSRERNRSIVPFTLMMGMILSNIRLSMSNDRRCGIQLSQVIVESINSSPMINKEQKLIAFSFWLNDECWSDHELFILR